MVFFVKLPLMNKILFAAIALAVIFIAGLLIISLSSDEEAKTNQNEDLSSTAPVSDIVSESFLNLPEREGTPRQTSGSVPHIQLDAEPVKAVDSELRRRVFLLPGVEDAASDRSLPGARGLALSGDTEIARADVISGSNEFAHIHPDGSLHVWLPVASAIEVDQNNWGELHPWVERDDFWDGVVMVFTPESPEDLEVTIEIIVDAYNFVTGFSLAPADIL